MGVFPNKDNNKGNNSLRISSKTFIEVQKEANKTEQTSFMKTFIAPTTTTTITATNNSIIPKIVSSSS